MSIEQGLYDAALELIKIRYPSKDGGAAAVRTQKGTILTSISPSVENDALSLCMEVGAILEAEKLDEQITHSICLYRENSKILILTPCGICQERLIHWGDEVMVAISNPQNKLNFVQLKELMPHHWSQVNRALDTK